MNTVHLTILYKYGQQKSPRNPRPFNTSLVELMIFNPLTIVFWGKRDFELSGCASINICCAHLHLVSSLDDLLNFYVIPTFASTTISKFKHSTSKWNNLDITSAIQRVRYFFKLSCCSSISHKTVFSPSPNKISISLRNFLRTVASSPHFWISLPGSRTFESLDSQTCLWTVPTCEIAPLKPSCAPGLMDQQKTTHSKKSEALSSLIKGQTYVAHSPQDFLVVHSFRWNNYKSRNREPL